MIIIILDIERWISSTCTSSAPSSAPAASRAPPSSCTACNPTSPPASASSRRTSASQLFIREGKRLHVSPAGRTLLGYADRLLDLAREAREAVHQEHRAACCGSAPWRAPPAVRLPGPLSAYHRRYPAVTLELRTGNPGQLAAAILDGELDAALAAEPIPDAPFEKVPVFDEELVIIAPADHPPIKSPRDAAQGTILVFEAGCPHRRRLEEWFARKGESPGRRVEMSSYHAMLGCVIAGMGVSLLPKSVLDAYPERRRLGVHNLPAGQDHAQTVLFWRKGADLPKVRALAEILLSQRRTNTETAKTRVKTGDRGPGGVAPPAADGKCSHIESNRFSGGLCSDDTAIGKFGRCASACELQRRVRHLRGDVDVACGRSRVAGTARPRHLVGDGRRARHLRGAAVAALRGAPPVRRTRSGGERSPAGPDRCPDDGRQRAVGSCSRREFATQSIADCCPRRRAEPWNITPRRDRARSRPWPIRAIRTLRLQAAASALAGVAGTRFGAGAARIEPQPSAPSRLPSRR